MGQAKKVLLPRMIQNGGDAIAGAVTLGVWGEIIPAAVGVFGIVWFVLRLINFIRVNAYDKDTWGGMG